ncbi:MAG TPA: CrcB family protein [Nitrososphaera sp.]|nr:CrcB family protein [Nitrososphaera sp.]
MPTRIVKSKRWWACDEKMKGLIIELMLIAIGAVAGAFLRYRITSSPLLILDILSINVLIVNVIGSFILGVFSVLAVAWNLDSKYSLLVAVGFCGSLTTMSSFALETARFIDERFFGKMTVNLVVNIGFSIGAIIAGRQLVNAIMIFEVEAVCYDKEDNENIC